MTEVRKNIELTEKDFIHFERMSFLGGALKNLGILLMFCLFIFMVWYYATTGQHFWIMVLSILPPLSYAYTLIYVIPKNTRPLYEESMYKARQPLFVLTKETLTVERHSGSISTLKLKDLKTAWEKGNYFYFYITHNNMLSIPKRQLNEEETAFLREVIQGLPREIRKSPYRVNWKQLLLSALMVSFVVFSILMIIWSFTVKPG